MHYRSIPLIPEAYEWQLRELRDRMRGVAFPRYEGMFHLTFAILRAICIAFETSSTSET